MRRGRFLRVRAAAPALATMRSSAAASAPWETGGILLGWPEGASFVVHRAIEVPDSSAGQACYTRRAVDAQDALDAALAGEPPGSPLGYIGEWHSHPAPMGPSRRDLRTTRQFSLDLNCPLVLIVMRLDGDEWRPTAVVSGRWRTRSAEIETT